MKEIEHILSDIFISSNMTSYLEQENVSETVLENFEKITAETEWIDPYDSIWLKLGTIIVYLIEGKYSSINNIKLTVHYRPELALGFLKSEAKTYRRHEIRAKKLEKQGSSKSKGSPFG